MTVWVNLIEDEGSSDLQSDGRLINTYRQKYRYQTNALTRPSKEDIAADIGIAPGSPFGDDYRATARGAKIVSIISKIPYQVFEAEFHWSTDAPLPLSLDPDPTTRRTLWSSEPNGQSRSIIKDRNGKVIIHTNGLPPEGGVPVNVRLGVVVAKKNRSAVGYDMNARKRLSGRWNSVSFLGEDPGTIQLDLSMEEKYEGAYHFWEETYRFTWDPQGIQPQFPSAGLSQMVTVDGERKRQPITARDLNPKSLSNEDIQVPEPLDEIGVLVPIDSRPDGCYIVKVDYFDSLDFNSFGL